MIARSHTTTIITAHDIQEIIRQSGADFIMDQLIERLHKAILSFDPKQTQIPIRSGFHYEKPEPGLIEWMPLYESGEEVVIKVVGYHPYNPERYKFPTILSTFSSYDTCTGHLNAIADGVIFTALRTGAASAVASMYMADAGSETLGLIGCGAQAVTQLHALSRQFPVSRVLCYDVDAMAVQSFPHRVEMLGLSVDIIPAEIEEIVKHSDILVTATSIDVGAGPLFSGIETQEHLHVNAVGSDFPGKTELPMDLLTNSLVCPDFRAQAIVEGECQQLNEDEIGPDIASLIQQSGSYKNIKSKRTVFDSTGWPLEDQIVMDLFMEAAADLGLGKEVELEHVPKDAKSPYDFLSELVSVPSSGN